MHTRILLMSFLIAGSNGQISMHRRLELPFTCAFMQEVMRFRTIGPLGVVHATSEDAQLGGYVIPKGTTVNKFGVGLMSLEN